MIIIVFQSYYIEVIIIMSNVDTPPNPWFFKINFNPSFFPWLSNYLTETIANSKYLRLVGGILSGNLGIKRTPQVELDVKGKAYIDNDLGSNPINGVYGGNGTRLILYIGTVSTVLFSFGIGTNILWYATASTGFHVYYTGTSDGNVGIGTDDPGT